MHKDRRGQAKSDEDKSSEAEIVGPPELLLRTAHACFCRSVDNCGGFS